MYDELFERLLTARVLKISTGVTISSLRRGINKEVQSYIEQCELLDMDVPSYHAKIREVDDSVFEIELLDSKPDPRGNFAFTIIEDEPSNEKI